MVRKYYSVRVRDPALCAGGTFGTQDLGRPGGLKRVGCVLQSKVQWIDPKGRPKRVCVGIRRAGKQKRRTYPKNKKGECIAKSSAKWVTQRYLLEKKQYGGHVGVQCRDVQACQPKCETDAAIRGLCGMDARGTRELASLTRRGTIAPKKGGDFKLIPKKRTKRKRGKKS